MTWVFFWIGIWYLVYNSLVTALWESTIQLSYNQELILFNIIRSMTLLRGVSKYLGESFWPLWVFLPPALPCRVLLYPISVFIWWDTRFCILYWLIHSFHSRSVLGPSQSLQNWIIHLWPLCSILQFQHSIHFSSQPETDIFLQTWAFQVTFLLINFQL